MEKPNYILKFNDGRMAPKNETKAYGFVKTLAIIFCIILFLGSVLFGEFLLFSTSMVTWVCVIFVCGYLIKNGGHERKECYTELWFYNEYMIQYVPMYTCSKKHKEKQYTTLYYKDVKECLYRENLKKVTIRGLVDCITYKYDKDGQVEKTPNYHKKYEGHIKFYGVFEPNIDFISEIERHTPLKFKIQNN